MKILIIDDNAHHAELAAHALRQEGWEVETREQAEPIEDVADFDFLLLDYSMPIVSGLDVLRQLQEREIQTPVIFLTGHGNEVIASEAIKQGAYDYVVKDMQLLYLDRLPTILREAKSKHDLIQTNRFLIQELRRANERLQKMTFTDEMTGIYNYRFIQNQLNNELQRASRYGNALSICLIDIDHFKSFNDNYGHRVGDMVLKELAQIFQTTTRAVDFVGRYAGDEFVIIFPDTHLEDAVQLCERIRKKVEDHKFYAEGERLHVTVCIGVTEFDPNRRASGAELIDAADQCLYQAKRAGRNRVRSSLRVIKENTSFEPPTIAPGA